ncbi:MAG: aldo/keto reductase [Desulfurococcales archaeon]|nr:aldo/keto reductase [Desulfurococcales archaeon]
MRYVRLGVRGPRVSVVGLGFWQAGSPLWGWRGDLERGVTSVVERALEHGITFFDTAEIYGWGRSEELLGKALSALGVGDEVIVASKVGGFRGPSGIPRVVEAINRRLRRTVDLVQHHWPPPYTTGFCSVIRALEDSVKKGLAHSYGLSNYNSRELVKALECSRRIEPVSNQVQYSLAYRSVEVKLKGVMDERGIGLIAWSPLAKGALAGLREPVTRAQRGDKVFRAAASDEELQAALARVAERHGASKAQVALAWVIAKGGVPIPGLRRAERVEEYAGASDIVLDGDDLEELDKASRKYINMWGSDYRFSNIRVIPGSIQYIAIRAMGGV